jgi:hypothetical protein
MRHFGIRTKAQNGVSIFRIVEGNAFNGAGEGVHMASIHGVIDV